MVNFPTWIADYDSPALLDLFLSWDPSICPKMAFSPLRNSDHVAVSVSNDFSLNSEGDTLFHCVAYDYSRADWDGFHNNLRKVPWDDIFKLNASGDTGFCECVQVGIDVYTSLS